MKHQIYFLTCPVSNAVCYVGQSKNAHRRYEQHLVDRSDCAKAKWIRSLLELGQKPTLVIVSEVDEGIAGVEEDRWIAFGLSVGWPLRNEVLPDTSKLRFSYDLPEWNVAAGIQDTIAKYDVPMHVVLNVPRVQWWNRVVPLRRMPDVVKVFFATVDDKSFYLYYPSIGIDYENRQIVYGAPSQSILWHDCKPGRKNPAVGLIDWRDRVAFRSEDQAQNVVRQATDTCHLITLDAVTDRPSVRFVSRGDHDD